MDGIENFLSTLKHENFDVQQYDLEGILWRLPVRSRQVTEPGGVVGSQKITRWKLE
jgi:hypothetical protein